MRAGTSDLTLPTGEAPESYLNAAAGFIGGVAIPELERLQGEADAAVAGLDRDFDFANNAIPELEATLGLPFSVEPKDGVGFADGTTPDQEQEAIDYRLERRMIGRPTALLSRQLTLIGGDLGVEPYPPLIEFFDRFDTERQQPVDQIGGSEALVRSVELMIAFLDGGLAEKPAISFVNSIGDVVETTTTYTIR